MTRRAADVIALLLSATLSTHAGAQRVVASHLPGAFTRVVYLEDSAYTSANVSAGDVNGDGRLDLVLAKGRHWPLVDRVHLGDGRGRFPRAYALSATADRTYSALLADLDGDGDLDVITSNDRPDPGLVHLNRGDGTFTIGSSWGEAGWSTRQVQLADVDGDGAPDLIVANRSGQRPGASYICRGLGNGQLAQPCRAFANESSTSITPADLNGDGLIDLVVPHRDGGQGHVYLQQRGRDSLTFTRVPFGAADASIRLTSVVDLDGDGRLDIAAIDERRGVLVFLAREDGSFGDGRALDAAPSTGNTTQDNEAGRPYALAVADIDANGTPDLVIGYVRRAPEVRYNRGDGRTFDAVPFGDAEGAAYGFAIADLDRDGALDIAIARSEARNVVYFGAPGRR